MTPTRPATATRRAQRAGCAVRRWATQAAPCVPFARYWAGAGAVWPLADGLHAWLGTADTLPWASAGLTLTGIGLTSWACHTARTRDTLTRVFAPATAGLASVWCTAATITSPTGSPVWQLWAIGAPGLALAWSLTRTRRHPTSHDHQPGQLTLGTTDVPALGATPAAPVVPVVSASEPGQPHSDPSATATHEEGRIVTVTTSFQEPTNPTEPAEPTEPAMSAQAAAVKSDTAGAHAAEDGWAALGEDTPMDLSDLSDPPEDLDAMLGLPDDPEPDLPGDATSALPEEDPDVEDTLLPPTRPTRSEARVKLRKLLGRMAAHGRYEFSIRDLPEPAPLFGRGRSWLSGELSRLVDAGLLETGGQVGKATVYRIRTHETRDAT